MHRLLFPLGYQRTVLTALFLVASCCFCKQSQSQSFVYTHTSGVGGDGFVWDVDDPPSGLNNLDDGDSFYTPDGVEYYNYSGNTSFFDDSYQVAGNSGRIDAEAWWMNPLDGGDGLLEFTFFDTEEGGIDTLSFDFAWATSTDHAPEFLELQVMDYDLVSNRDEYVYFASIPLDDVFPGFSGFDGRAGRVTLDVADLTDDFTGEPFTTINDVLITNLDEIMTFAGSSEVAIDNVAINSDAVGPGSNVRPQGFNATTKYLRGTFDPGVQLQVINDGTGGTTFSAFLDPTSDAQFYSDMPATNEPIARGEVVNTGSVARIDKDEPSGTYVAQVRVVNDLEATDPDELYEYTVLMFDAPQLSDNCETEIDTAGGPTLTISNAAAGPHAGAMRAGVEVTARVLTSGFGAVGMQVGDFVEPGETEVAAATFNRYGKLSKTYNGTFRLELKMNSEAGSFLNGNQPVPDIEWNLTSTLEDTLNDSAAIGAGANYQDTIGVNTATTAATTIDGQSPGAQAVSMSIEANSGTNGTVVSDAIDLSFSADSGLYVLQLTFEPAALPGVVDAEDLRLLVLDETTTTWGEAIDNNSNAGAGGTLFLGSFTDYLNGPGGGLLDGADLSDYGVDVATGTAWAVLDHASIFSLGVLANSAVPGDYNSDGFVDAEDYTKWRDNIGAAAGTLPNDVDGGTIGAAQYLTWRTNYDSASTVQQASVPEPNSLLIATGMLAVLVTIRGRGKCLPHMV